MASLTRRQVMELLATALPLSTLGCRSTELPPEDRVCAHVYPATLEVPASLLTDFGPPPAARTGTPPFTTGLPDVFICTTAVPFLKLFPYFWPVAPEEFRRARDSIRTLYRIDELSAAARAEEVERWLAGRSLPAGSAGVFTLNDFTRYFARRLLGALRSAGLAEIVVFKDPRVPPWLCDAPAVQKRFRRPPP